MSRWVKCDGPDCESLVGPITPGDEQPVKGWYHVEVEVLGYERAVPPDEQAPTVQHVPWGMVISGPAESSDPSVGGVFCSSGCLSRWVSDIDLRIATAAAG